jgi:hypothetical protein
MSPRTDEDYNSNSEIVLFTYRFTVTLAVNTGLDLMKNIFNSENIANGTTISSMKRMQNMYPVNLSAKPIGEPSVFSTYARFPYLTK